MNKGILILGSSNSYGETQKISSYIIETLGIPIIDLNKKNISGFDYEFKNRDDDFHSLISEVVENYNLIIIATPVYWYTMSGIMKNFIDRLSDCLKIEKDTGRKLRGIKMAVVSCGSDHELKVGFHMPFIETAKYLGMDYIQDVHCWLENNAIPHQVRTKLDHFITQIQ